MTSSFDRAGLEALLGHTFQDPSWLEAAITHPSWTNEHGGRHYQRLELLGDAVLQLAVTRALFDRLPDAHEGALTEARKRVVRGASLAEVGRALGLAAHVRAGRGAEADAIRANPDVIEDLVEALIGAIYLDAGVEVATALVLRWLGAALEQALAAPTAPVSARSLLNERCQARHRVHPTYAEVARSGPEHDPVVVWAVTLPDGARFEATAHNQAEAREGAARAALCGAFGEG